MLLHIKAVEAKEVPKMDIGSLSDPYLTFKLSSSSQEWKTSYKNNTDKPVWNEEFCLPITTQLDDELTVKMFDKDTFVDDHISTKIFKVNEFPQGKVVDKWYNFTKSNKAPSGGQVRLQFHLDRYTDGPAFVNHGTQ